LGRKERDFLRRRPDAINDVYYSFKRNNIL
jgi:hypothetical protein